MYPTISHFIQDVFGVNIPLPIQTYGFFVALAFILGGYILMLELKRKESLGYLSTFKKKITIGAPASTSEIVISTLVGFLVGFKLVHAAFNYIEFVDNPQTFILSANGSWWGGLLVAAASGGWAWYDKKRHQLPKPKTEIINVHPYEQAGNLLLVTAVFGLLGTKIFHILENLDDFAQDPIGAIFSFSGLTFFGGLIVGGIAMVYYGYKNHIKPLHIADAGAVAVSLGYAIGRVGCQISGDGCWGVPNPHPKPAWMSFLPDWMWSYDFPHNVNRVGEIIDNCTGKYCYALDMPVYPTSFYETMMMLVVFGLLWAFRKKLSIPGLMFSVYLILQGFERFFIEQIRVNNQFHFLGMDVTQAEIIAVLLVISGITGVYLVSKNKKRLENY